jgi:Tol biopolymer transport system component
VPKWGPGWSRDGRMASLVQGGQGVVVSVVSGRATRHIRLPLAYAGSLAWSPDGSAFVLTARVDTTAPMDVFTVGTDGRHLKRLTWNLNASNASWRK